MTSQQLAEEMAMQCHQNYIPNVLNSASKPRKDEEKEKRKRKKKKTTKNRKKKKPTET